MGIEELYETVKEETNEPIGTEIIGTIPEWIDGSLYRIGPGKFEFGDTKYNHWFDGMALLHRFNISKGVGTYQNRYLQSDAYQRNMKANRIVVPEFGTAAYPDPHKNIFQRFFSYFQKGGFSDNTFVNLYQVGDKLYTCSDTNYLNRVDPETLERMEQVDLCKVVSVLGTTAHPHVDPDGTVHNIAGIYSGYSFIKITPPKTGEEAFCEKAQIMAKIPMQWKMKPSYNHSFAMTENYYILIEHPLVMNVWKLLSGKILGTAYNNSIEWYPECPVKFHIIDKKTGIKVNQEVSYQAEAFFTFHNINAYEDEGCIILDTVAYGKKAGVDKLINEITLDRLQSGEVRPKENEEMPSPYRFALPLVFEKVPNASGLVTLPYTSAEAMLIKGSDSTDSKVNYIMNCKYETLSKRAIDFPQINYWEVNAKKYRYIYGVGLNQFLHPESVVKIDIETKEVFEWYEENCFPSEPVFVSSPEGTQEDDGVLLSVGLTTGENRCACLLILDAKNMKEIGRARADVKIGFGIHGVFIKNK